MSRFYETCVVGSGMGGSMIAALNKDSDIALFERDSNLGGCASTFKRYGSYFNAGATTFVGYEENHPVKKIFDFANAKPSIRKSEIAYKVIQGEKNVDRVKDFEEFLEQVNINYPNKNNRIFWQKIKEIDEKFWTLQNVFYGKYSLKSYLRSLNTVVNLLKAFKFELLKSAEVFINESLGEISSDYQKFIDAQLLITIQTNSKDISLLSLALGLSYPFHDVFYVNGGMGALFDELLKEIEVKRKEEILKIIKEREHYRVISNKNEYLSKNIVLNSSIYNSSSLFDDVKIKEYYDSICFSDQSAFVINMIVDKKFDFLHHYLIILKNNIPNAISNSFFVSVSSKDDEKLSKRGYSITISTHTQALFWKNLSKDEYEKRKEETQEFIVNEFLKQFDNIKKEDIIEKFSGTSVTFNRYINRYNCGGKPLTIKNIFSLPSARTPFKGIYNIGDTVFAGQGWPGIAIGVMALNKELNS